MAINTAGINLENGAFTVSGNRVAGQPLTIDITADIVDSNDNGYEISFTNGGGFYFTHTGMLPLNEFEIVSGPTFYTDSQESYGGMTLVNQLLPEPVVIKMKRDWDMDISLHFFAVLSIKDTVTEEVAYYTTSLTPAQLEEGVNASVIGKFTKPTFDAIRVEAVSGSPEVKFVVTDNNATDYGLATVNTSNGTYVGLFTPSANEGEVDIIVTDQDLADVVVATESTGAFSYTAVIQTNGTMNLKMVDDVTSGLMGASINSSYTDLEKTLKLVGQGLISNSVIDSTYTNSQTKFASPWVVEHPELLGIFTSGTSTITCYFSPLSDHLTDFTLSKTGYILTDRVSASTDLVKYNPTTVELDGSVIKVTYDSVELHDKLVASKDTYTQLGFAWSYNANSAKIQVVDGLSGTKETVDTVTTYTVYDRENSIGNDAHARIIDHPPTYGSSGPVGDNWRGVSKLQVIEEAGQPDQLIVGMQDLNNQDYAMIIFQAFTDDAIFAEKTVGPSFYALNPIAGNIGTDGKTLSFDATATVEPTLSGIPQVIDMVKQMANGTFNGTFNVFVSTVNKYVEYSGNITVTVGENDLGDTVGYSVGKFGGITGAVPIPLPYTYTGIVDTSFTLSGVVVKDIVSVDSGDFTANFGAGYGLIRDELMSFKHGTVTGSKAVVSDTISFEEISNPLSSFSLGKSYSFDLGVSTYSSLAYSQQVALIKEGESNVTILKSSISPAAAFKALSVTGGKDTFTLQKKSSVNQVFSLTTKSGVEKAMPEANGLSVIFPTGSIGTALADSRDSVFFNMISTSNTDNVLIVGSTGEPATTAGYEASVKGNLTSKSLLINGKWNLDADIMSFLLDIDTGNYSMHLSTEALEAVGKVVTVTIEGVVLTGTIVEVDGSEYLSVDFGVSESLDEAFKIDGNILPFDMTVVGEVTLALNSVVLRGGDASNVYNKADSVGELVTDGETAQTVLDGINSITVEGNIVTFNTTFTEGGMMTLQDVDAVSSTGELFNVVSAVGVGGVWTYDDAAVATLFKEAVTNTMQFDIIVKEPDPEATFKIVVGANAETHKGYEFNVTGTINTRVMALDKNRFNENRELLIHSLITTDEGLILSFDETAIEQLTRTAGIITPMGSYSGTLTRINGRPAVNLGTAAAEEMNSYVVGFTLGLEIDISGVSTAYLDKNIARVAITGSVKEAHRDKSVGYIITAIPD